MEMDPDTERKLGALIKWFENKGSVLVAFSGGVDSTLVAKVAKMALVDKVTAATADSVTVPPGELDEAKHVADKIGLRHIIIKVNELSNSEFASNPPDRCYHCKRELISEFKKIAREKGIESIVDGTNADDLKTHRPGALALEEEGIHSPLAEVGLSKADVRKIARFLNLPSADKPSMACIASRFPYGQRITKDRVVRVAEAERYIRDLTKVQQLRVRDHGDIARIEVDRQERKLLFDEHSMDAIAKKLRSLGFTYVTMELTGYRSGSMDEALPS